MKETTITLHFMIEEKNCVNILCKYICKYMFYKKKKKKDFRGEGQLDEDIRDFSQVLLRWD